MLRNIWGYDGGGGLDCLEHRDTEATRALCHLHKGAQIPLRICVCAYMCVQVHTHIHA